MIGTKAWHVLSDPSPVKRLLLAISAEERADRRQRRRSVITALQASMKGALEGLANRKPAAAVPRASGFAFSMDDATARHLVDTMRKASSDVLHLSKVIIVK